MISRGDNPNKKTLIDIPDLVYNYSPMVPEKIGLRWENPNNMLDVSIPDRGPYLVDDSVPTCESKPNNRVILSSGGYLVNGVVSRVEAHPNIRIWKELGRGKLLGVHPHVGSDEGSRGLPV